MEKSDLYLMYNDLMMDSFPTIVQFVKLLLLINQFSTSANYRSSLVLFWLSDVFCIDILVYDLVQLHKTCALTHTNIP